MMCIRSLYATIRFAFISLTQFLLSNIQVKVPMKHRKIYRRWEERRFEL